MKIKQPIFSPDTAHPMAHCATLAVLPDGQLISAWYAGSAECAPDVVIFAATYHELTWSHPRVIARVPGLSLGQPVLLPLGNGDLVLFFVILPDRGGWRQARPFCQRSQDGSYTWSAPQPLLNYPGLMFRARPMRLAGRIILPVYDEITWQSRMLLSDDAALTWKLTAPITTPQGNIQPSLARLDDGRLLAYLRTGEKGGWIWRTSSSDNGETWETPNPTHLPNPNSGIDLLRTQSGRLILAYNPSASQRTPLAVTTAGQQENWQPPHLLEDGPGEYSYPALAQTPDGLIHLVYTWRRQTIAHICFSETWLG